MHKPSKGLSDDSKMFILCVIVLIIMFVSMCWQTNTTKYNDIYVIEIQDAYDIGDKRLSL